MAKKLSESAGSWHHRASPRDEEPLRVPATPKQDYSYTPSFTFKNLTPGQTYPYRLCAVGDAAGTSVVSVGITSSFTTMPCERRSLVCPRTTSW